MGDVLLISVQADNAFPELKPAVASGIPHQVDGNTDQPGVYACISSIAMPAPVCPQETVLRNGLSSIMVAQRRKNESVDAFPISFNDFVEITKFDGTGFHCGNQQF